MLKCELRLAVIFYHPSCLQLAGFPWVRGHHGDGIFSDAAEEAVHTILLVAGLDPELVPVFRDHVLTAGADIWKKEKNKKSQNVSFVFFLGSSYSHGQK